MARGGGRWHNAGFTYNLQRKYPFQYFTVSLTTVLVLLFILSTVYNIATNGYDLQPIYTFDPNSTHASRSWFLNSFFTLGDDKLDPKCPPRELEVGSYFTTTNLGYSYVLNAVNRVTDDRGQRSTYSSVSYLNNTLQDCRVTSVDIFLSQKTAVAKSVWFDWTQSYASIRAQCDIENGQGLLRLDFTTTYGPSDAPYSYVTNNDPQTHASIWWGMQLLRCYWIGITTLMGMDKAAASGNVAPYIDGALHFQPNESAVASADLLDDFSLNYRFLDTNGAILHQGIDGYNQTTLRYNNDDFRASRPLTEGLSFARAYASLIHLDLGQTNRTNLFDTEDSLKTALTSPQNFNRQAGAPLSNETFFDFNLYGSISSPVGDKNAQNIPLNQTYDRLRSQTGPLGTRKPYISVQYTCSIPTRKSVGTILWSTLVANFVLVAAARTLIMYIAEIVLSNRDPRAMYCDGCAGSFRQQDDNELIPLSQQPAAIDGFGDSSSPKPNVTGSRLPFSPPAAYKSNSSYSLIPQQHQPLDDD